MFSVTVLLQIYGSIIQIIQNVIWSDTKSAVFSIWRLNLLICFMFGL